MGLPSEELQLTAQRPHLELSKMLEVQVEKGYH